MSILRLMNQPLTVQAMGGNGTDEYGNTIPGELGPAVAALGFLEQKDTIEYQDDRQTVVSKWKAFLPAVAGATIVDVFADQFADVFGEPAEIGPLSYITFGSQRFQVDGAPWHVYNPRTKSVSHIECKLTVS